MRYRQSACELYQLLMGNVIFLLFRLESVPKSSISALPVNPHPVPARAPTDLPSVSVTKQLQMVPRGSQLYNTQQADIFYQDHRGTAPPFEPAPYQQGKFEAKLSVFWFTYQFYSSFSPWCLCFRLGFFACYGDFRHYCGYGKVQWKCMCQDAAQVCFSV